MYILGITGQSGSGKTTFAKYLLKYGFEHIDTDVIAREVVPEALPMLVSAFGDEILTNYKILNRKKLAKIAFSTRNNTDTLNSIMHPLIMKRLKQELISQKENGTNRVVIDGAALIEAGARNVCTQTATIYADEKIRIRRIMKRDNISVWQVKQRFSAQKPLSYYLDNTDFAIESNNYEQMLQNIEVLINKLNMEENT